MRLGNNLIDWVHSIKYLSVVFTSDVNLHVDCSYIKKNFYAACNAVLSKCKQADDLIKLHLIRSFCVSLLTYYIGALYLPKYKVRMIARMIVFEKILMLAAYSRFESVAETQFFCGELPFNYIYDLHRMYFFKY